MIDAASRASTNSIAGEIGGLTLTPGVLTSLSSVQITGTLTLDAQNDASAMWIFQTGTTLTVINKAKVVLCFCLFAQPHLMERRHICHHPPGLSSERSWRSSPSPLQCALCARQLGSLPWKCRGWLSSCSCVPGSVRRGPSGAAGSKRSHAASRASTGAVAGDLSGLTLAPGVNTSQSDISVTCTPGSSRSTHP